MRFLVSTRGTADMRRLPPSMRALILTACALIAALGTVFNPMPTATAGEPHGTVAVGSGLNEKLPMTGLTPAKLIPNLSSVHYRISTASPDCQAFFDQGLGSLYFYVWMEASRSFETAALKDPDCALAWWGLSRALDRWGRGDSANKALQKAHELRDRASHREQLLIQARIQEKGLPPYAGGNAEAHKKAATETIDSMISLFDDDEEAWFYRAQLGGGERLFGGTAAAAPFYKALVRLNPLHPAANHELLHHYENIQRPALGWLHAESYIKSSPATPHAFH